MWMVQRAEMIRQSLREIIARGRMRYAFKESHETAQLGYFPGKFGAEMPRSDSEIYLPNERIAEADVVITTAHGGDLAEKILEIRRIAPRVVVAAWAWDNHVSQMRNLRTANMLDFMFASHRYCAMNLVSPACALGGHIPLASTQWTREEAGEYFQSFTGQARSGRVLANYVDYEQSWRSKLLHQLAELPQMEVKLMPPADRSRYFNLARRERFKEWADYKSSVILPLTQDLSSRLFDALLTGQVPIVPRNVLDLDLVIPPAMQAELGIVRFEELTAEAVATAASEAIAIYDRMGEAGALKRHRFALENHMTGNRVGLMLTVMRAVGTGEMNVSFLGGGEMPYGLYVQGGN